MQLTLNTDYSLRVLLYVAERPGELISTKDISQYFGISHNHLVKVVNVLGKLEYLTLKRGRYGGGMSLAKKPEDINIGDVINALEPLDIVECFNVEKNTCIITSNCKLKGLLAKAKRSFLAELRQKTLADML